MGRYAVSCEVWDGTSAYVKHVPSTRTAVAVKRRRASDSETTEPERTGEFTRMQSGGSFMVSFLLLLSSCQTYSPSLYEQIAKSYDKVWDEYEPSRVTDLSAIEAKRDIGRAITILFTAPGDDLDSGTASLYEIRYSKVVCNVQGANFTIKNSTIVQREHLVDGSLLPLESGSRQSITFLLKDDDKAETYFIALRSIDHTNRTSRTSNIVTAHFPSCPTKCISQYPGFCWDKTDFGTTANRDCPNNFEGTATWTCGTDGKWSTPFPDLR